MASFLGIDLSKETFHACLLGDHAEAKKAFPNTSKGFEQLTAWLKNRHADDVHICMEATGAYWEALASYLHGLEQRVSVVNPARIKAFAQSELLRTKTDEIDAALIARFCKSPSPEPWLPPPAEIRILQALMRHYEHLKTTRAQQSVYAQSSEAAIVTASIREVIATLDEQIAQVERKIRQHFDDHPDLKRRRDLLTSIPGIGETNRGLHSLGNPASRPIPVCQSCRRICRTIAARAPLWNIDSRSHAAVQDRQRSRSQGALHAGDGCCSLQPDSPDLRRTAAGCWKTQAARHRRRHAQTFGSRLWHSAIRKAFRRQLCLTSNTVSIPSSPCPRKADGALPPSRPRSRVAPFLKFSGKVTPERVAWAAAPQRGVWLLRARTRSRERGGGSPLNQSHGPRHRKGVYGFFARARAAAREGEGRP